MAVIPGDDDNDDLPGGSAADSISGLGGDDTLTGGFGDDTLLGGAGNDRLLPGDGDDSMLGGAGADRFVIDRRSFDEDTIGDFAVGSDRIDVSFLGVADLATLAPFLRAVNGTDTELVLRYGSQAEVLTIRNVLPAQLGAASFVFNANPLGVLVEGSSGSDVLFGGLGNDTLDGGFGDDTLTAGAGADRILLGDGDDSLVGGGGADRFAIDRRSFDADTIGDFAVGSDRIDVSFLGVADLATLAPFLRIVNGTDTELALRYGGQAELLTIRNVLPAQLTAASFVFNLNTPGRLAEGSSGADVLFGGLGNDTLDGGFGDDTLTAGAGADRILLGDGDDSLVGGAGADRFAIDRRGFDEDIIGDFAVGSDRIDVSFLGVADFAALAPFLRIVNGTDTELALRYGSQAELLTIRNVLPAQLTAASFVFNLDTLGRAVEGSSGGDVLFGGLGEDTLTGGFGNDTLSAGAGNDRLLLGNGDDLAVGGSGVDSVIFAKARGAYTIVYDFPGNAVIVTGEGTDTISADVENLVFTDQTVAVQPLLPRFSVSGPANPVTEGTGGPKAITFTVTRAGPTTGESTLSWEVVGTGASPVNAADFVGGVLPKGNLTFAAGQASRTITVSIAGDATFEPNETFLLRLLNPSNGVLLNAQVTTTIRNDDSASVTLTGGNNTYAGSDGNDTVYGRAGQDSIDGGAGNDRLYGEVGRDTLVGGAGADGLFGASGADSLVGGAGADTFVGGTGDDTIVSAADGVRDVIRLASLADGGDLLVGFVSGQDRIDLSRAGFGLGTGFVLNGTTFVAGAGPAAPTEGPTFLYDTVTRVLSLDANGNEPNGVQAPFVVLQLAPGSTLLASDILLF